MFIGIVTNFTIFKKSKIEALSIKLYQIQVQETKMYIDNKIKEIGKNVVDKQIDNILENIQDKNNHILALINELNNIYDCDFTNLYNSTSFYFYILILLEIKKKTF